MSNVCDNITSSFMARNSYSKEGSFIISNYKYELSTFEHKFIKGFHNHEEIFKNILFSFKKYVFLFVYDQLLPFPSI